MSLSASWSGEYADSSKTVTPWKSNSAGVPSVLLAALKACAIFAPSVSVSLENLYVFAG